MTRLIIIRSHYPGEPLSGFTTEHRAAVAELADAPDSGSGPVKVVGVRVPSAAP